METARVRSPRDYPRRAARPPRLGALVALAAVALTITGCPPARRTLDPRPPRTTRLDAGALAGRLGLQVQRSNRYAIRLGGSGHSLLIMGPPQPVVLVDGRALDPGNDIVRHDGRLEIRPVLAERIARRLGPVRRSQPDLVEVAPAPDNRSGRSSVRGAVVVLDAGHGGKDPGALNAWGPDEKVLVLDTVHHIAAALRPYGVRLILTRDDDTFVELNDRAAIANDADADLFVSIHADAHPSAEIDGFTLYIAPGAPPKTTRLAECIADAMAPDVGMFRGIRDNRTFRVLMRTRMPAVLVELGYLTHPAEAARLSTPAYRRRLAGVIAEGIVAFLRSAR